MRRHALEGIIFGRLVVVEAAPRTYQTMWHCLCECGTLCTISGQHLTLGKTRSCGCLREELRPTYARRRDFRGTKNPRAKSSARVAGTYVPSSSVWYKRASGIFYGAKKKGVPVGFASVAALCAYIQPLIPERCPVFNRPFVERGAGFSKWSPSIDKIDPQKGYIPGNIQIISMLANCMKRDASRDELLAFSKWIQEQT